MTDVHRENFRRATLQKTISESSSRCADIERDFVLHIDSKKIQCAGKFQRAPAGELRRLRNRNRRIDIDQLCGLCENAVPYPDLAGHDRALGAFAAFEKSALDQNMIYPGFLFHCSSASNLSIAVTSSAVARRR